MGNIYDEIINVIKTSLDLDNAVKKDNFVFRLHRAYSVFICIIFAVLLSLSQVSQIHMCKYNFYAYKMIFLKVKSKLVKTYHKMQHIFL